MKQHTLALLFLLSLYVTSFGQQAEWQLVYEHDENGEVLTGSKQALIDAVREGQDVKIGWVIGAGEKSVEHWAPAQFLTIMNGEVFGQITPILSQNPSFEQNLITFREGMKWSFIASTSGKNATSYHTFDGSTIDDTTYRWGNKWYVRK